MIKLENLPNVTAPTAEFPYGDVKDRVGLIEGTKMNRESLSDVWQFFAKLADEGDVTPNGIVDNEYDGFQLFEALIAVNGGLSTIVELGVWDMDATLNVTIAHGIVDHTKIHAINVVVVDDNGQIYPLDFGGTYVAGPTNIIVSRDNGGNFDNTSFNDGVINRGHIFIKHSI